MNYTKEEIEEALRRLKKYLQDEAKVYQKPYDIDGYKRHDQSIADWATIENVLQSLLDGKIGEISSLGEVEEIIEDWYSTLPEGIISSPLQTKKLAKLLLGTLPKPQEVMGREEIIKELKQFTMGFAVNNKEINTRKYKMDELVSDEDLGKIADALLNKIPKPREVSEEDIEVMCEQVHKAYCKYHLEHKGVEYWTKGDYSKLNEEGKEYDRRTVRAVLTALKKEPT